MDGQEKLLDYETIKAAVAAEKWATEKVLAHYADYIDELSTVEIRQPGGKVKKVIDEDMRQHISLWVNVGIKIAAYLNIRIVLGVESQKLKVEVRRCGC